MRNWHFLIFLLFCLCNLAGASPGGHPEPERTTKKPNIIFILTDDLGYGDLGVFFQQQREQEKDRSEPWHFTPNLDQLAEDGVRLTQQYCNAPVCAPSRASLLLGVHQGHANIRDNQFDKALEDNYTLGNVLRTLGYATVAVGKWGLQGNKKWGPGQEAWPGYPLDRGFDDYFGYIRHGDGHEHYPKEGLYRKPKEVYDGREEISGTLDKCYTADLWTAYAKKWIAGHLKEKQSGQPFFMYLAYDTPHAVLELPTQAYPEGKGLRGGLQWTGEPGHMINTASGKPDSWMHPDYAGATWDDDRNAATPEVPWPETYKRYATAVRRIDDAVGDIRQLLKDLGIDSNTLIVFSSDNGPSKESYLPKEYAPNEPVFFNSFGPFDGIKRDSWEGGLRMPVLAAWPSVIPGNRIVDTPSMLSDWMATFCDAAGMPAPARSDGVSLLPALTGKGKQAEPLVYVEYYQNGKTPEYSEFAAGKRGRKRNQMQMIRFGDYVGLRYDVRSAADNFGIYNVVNDPKQTTDLAGRPEMAGLQEQMKERVLQVRRPDTSAARPYDNELVPASEAPDPAPGLVWHAYPGPFPWVPHTASLKPAATGRTPRPQPGAAAEMQAGALLFEGYIRVPEDGEYTFYLRTDGGALLRIHEATVIDADYGYNGETERRASLLLERGLHPFRMTYARKNGKIKPSWTLLWSGPGFDRTPVPEKAFYHTK